MKVKDFNGINPEADIYVSFSDGTQFDGELSYGWETNDCDENIDTKSTTKRVDIFLGMLKENVGNA